ncbi:MAG: response regulator, partial [Myxococcales bacterium]|nr:response regulator [Myxococcales bacterium]
DLAGAVERMLDASAPPVSVAPASLAAPSLRGSEVALAARASAPEFELDPDPDAAPGRSGTGAGSVLVVDDEERNRDMLAKRLGRKGYAVTTAASGEAALALMEGQAFDLVVLDVMMPGMDGLEVLDVIRKRHPASALPVLMATARGDSSDIVEALRRGANDYVTKPVDFPVILARLRLQLALKEATDRARALAAELAARSRFIRDVFGRYVSEEVVDAVLASPVGLELRGEMREVSVLMADLRGFTAVVESLDPAGVVELLNSYLGTMTDVISRFGGTVDEFIGDGILAVFGAPLCRPDDAERALACAVAMQCAMTSVNAFNAAHGLPAVEMGVAVNTGRAVVGNIGSRKRAKYGVVGSTVNLASRIESLSVGGQVLTSAATQRASGDVARVGARRTVRVKGAADPLEVLEVLGVVGRFALDVPPRAAELRALERGVPVALTRLAGKELEATRHEGTIVALSPTGATIATGLAVPELGDVRILLSDGDGEVEIYAKVLSGHAGSATVCFTSVPARAASVLAEVRARAERRELT